MKMVVKAVVLPLSILILGPRLHGQSDVEQGAPSPEKNFSSHQRELMNCDMDWVSETETGRDFSVRVAYQGSPLAGHKVILAKSDSVGSDLDSGVSGDQFEAEDQTDSQGVARFFGIPPGRYKASIGGLKSPVYGIRVRQETALRPEIKMEWPMEPTAVRHLQGNLGVIGKAGVLPLSAASLEVFELRTALPVMEGFTDAKGHYAFSSLPPDLYVLRVDLPAEVERKEATCDISVDLNLTAREDEMPATKFFRYQSAGVKASMWEDPDKRTYEQALAAIRHKQFDVAHMTLQMLINTYPGSAYARKAEELLQNPKIGDCENVWSSPACIDVRFATAK